MSNGGCEFVGHETLAEKEGRKKSSGEGSPFEAAVVDNNPNAPTNDPLSERSCWEQAAEKLRLDQPKLYKHLEEFRATQPQPPSSEALADDMFKVIDTNKKIMENRELPLPWKVRNEDEKVKIRKALNNVRKAVLVFRDLGQTVANIDPLHAGIAWVGVNLILQVRSEATITMTNR